MQAFFANLAQWVSKYSTLLINNWERALLGGIIVVSAVITIIGLLKKFVIDKLITNKLVRKIVLAFSSIILVFPLTALYYVGDGVNFDHYWVGCALNIIATILCYWGYENTGFRNFLHWVGNLTIGKLWNAFVGAITRKKNVDAPVVLLQEVTKELKKDTLTGLVQIVSNSKHDKDLDNL